MKLNAFSNHGSILHAFFYNYCADYCYQLSLSLIFAVMSANPVSISSMHLKEYKNVPASSPSPGVMPDFSARNQRADVLCFILSGTVYVAVCLSIYAKGWIQRNLGLDDCGSAIMPSLMTYWLIHLVAVILQRRVCPMQRCDTSDSYGAVYLVKCMLRTGSRE